MITIETMDKKQLRVTIYVSLAFNAILLVIIAISLFAHRSNPPVQQGQNDFPFLSQRIFAENQNDLLVNFVPLRNALHDYVDKQHGDVGVYFEYLPSGTSIVANSDMEVKIASLVKIPTVMAIYKAVEHGRLSLDKQLTVSEKDLDNGFGELWKKGAGTQLSVQEAIDLSLKQSDNTAHNLLLSQLNDQDVTDVLNSLDIPLEEDGNQFAISPKNYTSILRSLYLSSYLTKADSNTVLDKLANTEFSDKLPAGIPAGIRVAHKIGVLNPRLVSTEKQVYSDCGIIYVPNRPYALCVMVKNNSNAKSTDYIRHISDMVYKYIDVAK